jgi:hypothetical protein
MPRKYTGNTDGNSGKALPGTQKLLELCKKRWEFTNLGIWANRSMKNPKAIPGDPKWLSVHATGRAIDIGNSDRKKVVEAWNWFLANTAALGIEEIHDYGFDSNKADKVAGWGRGYRCSRGEGSDPKSVKIYDDKENAGSQGGHWLHLELSPAMAKDAAKFEAAWRALPKPGA